MSTAAIIRICGYIIGVGSLLTGQIVSAIIAPYGASQNTVTHVLAIVGSIVTLATLIKGVIDSVPSSIPPGYSNVITPTTTAAVQGDLTANSVQPPILTTAEAVKKGS